MKTLLAIILSIAVLAGSSSENISENIYGTKSYFENGVSYRILDESHGALVWLPDRPDVDPERLENAGIITPIHSKEEALKVGMDIINVYHADGIFPEYNLFGIVHSPSYNDWCFTYSVEPAGTKEHLYLGGAFYVGIDGNKGEIIQIWMGD